MGGMSLGFDVGYGVVRRKKKDCYVYYQVEVVGLLQFFNGIFLVGIFVIVFFNVEFLVVGVCYGGFQFLVLVSLGFNFVLVLFVEFVVRGGGFGDVIVFVIMVFSGGQDRVFFDEMLSVFFFWDLVQ